MLGPQNKDCKPEGIDWESFTEEGVENLQKPFVVFYLSTYYGKDKFNPKDTLTVLRPLMINHLSSLGKLQPSQANAKKAKEGE